MSRRGAGEGGHVSYNRLECDSSICKVEPIVWKYVCQETHSKFRGNVDPVNCHILLLIHRNKGIQLAKLDGGPLRVIYAGVPIGNPGDAALSRSSLHRRCVRHLEDVFEQRCCMLGKPTLSAIRSQSNPSTLLTKSMGVLASAFLMELLRLGNSHL